MTKAVLEKLKDLAFEGYTIAEACSKCDITERTYYTYWNKEPEFLQEMQALRQASEDRLKDTWRRMLSKVQLAEQRIINRLLDAGDDESILNAMKLGLNYTMLWLSKLEALESRREATKIKREQMKLEREKFEHQKEKDNLKKSEDDTRLSYDELMELASNSDNVYEDMMREIDKYLVGNKYDG